MVNMKRLYKNTCFFAIGILLISGCIKRPEYSDIPEITFLSFITEKNDQGKDQTGYLVLEFTDGNGDIGLSQSDTLPPYQVNGEHYYNFFVTFYQKINNNFQPLSTPYNARIPRMGAEGTDRDMKGEIQIEIDLRFLPLVLQSNIIKFEIQIEDRALNKSNTVTSPEFELSL